MMWTKLGILLGALFAVVVLSGCGGQVKADTRVVYQYREGRTAVVHHGQAIAPANAPLEVKRAIAAANRIAGMRYKWGGGHAVLDDNGYDCSGATSYVLRNAGLMRGQMPSRGFFNYGEPGKGEWITVYVRDGHVFLTIAGLRFDTMGRYGNDGPKWSTDSRSGRGHVMRHPAGL
jgi:hypothetical protein